MKSARKVAKGETKFSNPKQVVRVMKNTVELDDGNICHMSCLAKQDRSKESNRGMDTV